MPSRRRARSCSMSVSIIIVYNLLVFRSAAVVGCPAYVLMHQLRGSGGAGLCGAFIPSLFQQIAYRAIVTDAELQRRLACALECQRGKILRQTQNPQGTPDHLVQVLLAQREFPQHPGGVGPDGSRTFQELVVA